MIRDLKALAADLAGYNSGVFRARVAYAEKQARVKRCRRCGTYRPLSGRCRPCDSTKNRQWRNRKKENQA